MFITLTVNYLNCPSAESWLWGKGCSAEEVAGAWLGWDVARILWGRAGQVDGEEQGRMIWLWGWIPELFISRLSCLLGF